MSTSALKGKVFEVVGVVLAMIAVLIMAGMTAAASIEEALKAGVITGASFIELYLLLWMLKQF